MQGGGVMGSASRVERAGVAARNSNRACAVPHPPLLAAQVYAAAAAGGGQRAQHTTAACDARGQGHHVGFRRRRCWFGLQAKLLAWYATDGALYANKADPCSYRPNRRPEQCVCIHVYTHTCIHAIKHSRSYLPTPPLELPMRIKVPMNDSTTPASPAMKARFTSRPSTRQGLGYRRSVSARRLHTACDACYVWCVACCVLRVTSYVFNVIH